MFCSEELSFLPFKNSNKSLNFSSGQGNSNLLDCQKYTWRFLPQRHIFCQITGTKCSGLIFEPPFSTWRAQLDPQKVVTGQQSILSKLSFKNYWLLSFHDMISTLHPAKIIFYHVMFNFNSNDRDVLTQSLLTLWSRIDFLDQESMHVLQYQLDDFIGSNVSLLFLIPMGKNW